MTSALAGSIILGLIVAIIVVAVAAYLLNWLYHRSTKEVAFVRTGFGGETVVIDGGAFVLPIVHQVTPVNLNVVRIPVSRAREEAVITRDRMRVDIEAEFFVRVLQEPRAVAAAASTLGRRTLDPEGLADLLAGKFVGALRSAATEMTLDEIHEKRGGFVAAVGTRAGEALARNGLELESVAITDLDQTGLEFFDPANRFDAEGLTRLIEEIEGRRKARNDIEQSAMVEIRARNLEAEKATLKLEQESETSRLDQERDLEALRAGQRAAITRDRVAREAEAERARIGSERETAQYEIERRQTLETAEIAAQEELEKARIAQQQTIEQARIARDRRLREQQVAQRQSVEEVEIAAAEEVERARIASDRGLDEARVLRERDLRRLEIEREQALEVAELERRIAVQQKEAEEADARVATEAARARAAVAEEQVATAREREAAERIAAVDRLLADKDADVARVAAEAEKAAAAAAAEGQRLHNEAANALSEDARAAMLRTRLIERLEGIVRESVRPMEKIDGIRILHVDGLGGGSGGGRRSPTDEVIESALRYRAQAPLIDELMKEIGIENSNVSGMGDIFRSARDARSLAETTKKEDE